MQCYNGYLNAYIDKCLDIISCSHEFVTRYIPRDENGKANALAQQASGYNVVKKYVNIQKPMQAKVKFQVLDELVWPVEATGLTTQNSLTGLDTCLTGGYADDTNSAVKDDLIVKAEYQDCWVPIISYLNDPGRGQGSPNRWELVRFDRLPVKPVRPGSGPKFKI